MEQPEGPVQEPQVLMAGLANALQRGHVAGAGLDAFFVKYTQLGDSQSTFLFVALLIAIGCVAVWAAGAPLLADARVADGAHHPGRRLCSPAFANSPTAASAWWAACGRHHHHGSIGARIIDEDTRKHNLRREGIISNALGFMNCLNGLFTSAAFLVSVLFGFVSGDNPGPSPQRGPLPADRLSRS